MTNVEMVLELTEMISACEMYDDECEHCNYSSTQDRFCAVCFVLNLATNCSPTEPEFIEETTEAQRDTLANIYDRWANA